MNKNKTFIQNKNGDKMEKNNQRIKCNVKACKFNAKLDQECTLSQITVAGANKKLETFCDNFEQE